MIVEIDGKFINLFSISALTTVGGGEMMMTRIHLIGGAYVDIKQKHRDYLISAMKKNLRWHEDSKADTAVHILTKK